MAGSQDPAIYVLDYPWAETLILTNGGLVRIGDTRTIKDLYSAHLESQGFHFAWLRHDAEMEC
jgi:hypothetical protein